MVVAWAGMLLKPYPVTPRADLIVAKAEARDRFVQHKDQSNLAHNRLVARRNYIARCAACELA